MMIRLSPEADKEAERSIWMKMRASSRLINKKTVKSYCKNFNPYEKEKTRGSMLSL